jgi:hypothetical protein
MAKPPLSQNKMSFITKWGISRNFIGVQNENISFRVLGLGLIFKM